MNLPNKLTLARVLLVPIFMVAFYLQPGEQKYIALVIFCLAGFTDFLDGYVARKKNLVTDFGKLMDPIADKVLVATAFVLLTQAGRVPGAVTVVVISREFLISGVRQLAASKGWVIAAGRAGKLKTMTQMQAIILFLLIDPSARSLPAWAVVVAGVLLYASLALAIYSAYEYVRGYLSFARE